MHGRIIRPLSELIIAHWMVFTGKIHLIMVIFTRLGLGINAIYKIYVEVALLVIIVRELEGRTGTQKSILSL